MGSNMAYTTPASAPKTMDMNNLLGAKSVNFLNKLILQSLF
ncbi:hypothetical protein PPEP_a2290 [Pseudoalteromonas peptidolytica F12-50-A1]|uniref:Uncharacterized protein n=1 Tax=Pseudoalteromonas peptidolytica F12-50-A1 TaxID=1315280 RepID=A0A8I0T3W9_9GAMM|nr:hypothetical protein [Pseudoalteromonas peptidolytica F12-50-A1]